LLVAGRIFKKIKSTLKTKIMFRIVKKTRGYIVEVQVSKWTLFGLKKVWKPYVKSSGLDCAWHHKSYEMAVMNFKSEVLADLESNTEFSL
jgi:hypothetical protein